MDLPIDGLTLEIDPPALLVRSRHPLETLASSLVGAGFAQARAILNLHVDKDYQGLDPAADLRQAAAGRGLGEPFVGMMTAVYVERTRLAALRDGDLCVCAVVTAGVGNATSAGISAPARLLPGTINLILLVDGCLSQAAMVNAVITATEAKCDVLRQSGLRTADGDPATGTSTDSIVVAHTGRGARLEYAGPATPVGWLAARAVRAAFGEALAQAIAELRNR